MAWQERMFKTNKVNFYLLYQRFCWQSFIKREGDILVRILIPKQYQMMASSVARFKFIKTKFIIGYHTKDVSIQVSSNLDHVAKCYSCSNSNTKIGKNEIMGKHFLSNKAGQSGDYKYRQVLVITNRDKRDCK